MIYVSGASDDLVVVDGDCGISEHEAYDRAVVLQVGDTNFGGIIVEMEYGKHGATWEARIRPIDEDVPMPPVEVKLADNGYSPLVCIDVPREAGVMMEVM